MIQVGALGFLPSYVKHHREIGIVTNALQKDEDRGWNYQISVRFEAETITILPEDFVTLGMATAEEACSEEKPIDILRRNLLPTVVGLAMDRYELARRVEHLEAAVSRLEKKK